MAPACWSASYFPDRYDSAIKSAVETYLPGHDWRLLKAQYYQESLLRPDAVSPAGAQGIAQFMPGTWTEVMGQLGKGQHLTPFMAEPAIDAGAFYMARMLRIWFSPRPPMDRYSLALASYNAGAGNLIAAQRECHGVLLYAEIIGCLPAITGRHSRETITYVQRIWGYWQVMVLGV